MQLSICPDFALWAQARWKIAESVQKVVPHEPGWGEGSGKSAARSRRKSERESSTSILMIIIASATQASPTAAAVKHYTDYGIRPSSCPAFSLRFALWVPLRRFTGTVLAVASFCVCSKCAHLTSNIGCIRYQSRSFRCRQRSWAPKKGDEENMQLHSFGMSKASVTVKSLT